jgi:iron(III) transport system substrate-binding protein
MALRQRVVVYSAAEQTHCAPLLEGFSERHPDIEVDFRFGISVDLHARYLTQVASAESEVDVMWSSAMDLQMALIRAGEALTHESTEKAALPPGAVYRNLGYATTVEPLATLVDRERLGRAPLAGSLAELAALWMHDPRSFRGRVAAFDIERNGQGFLALLVECRSETDAEGFMRALARCEPRLGSSNPELVDDVASGNAVLACHVLSSYAERAMRAHASLATAHSDGPPLAVSRIAFISRHSRHPEAAHRFLDYLLSLEGQQRLAAGGFPPIREDAAASESAGRALRTIPIDDGLADILDPLYRNRVLQRWRAAVGRATSS